MLQKRQFSHFLFQSISYNNLVVTKQIHFSATFRKKIIGSHLVGLRDNIAGVVGSPVLERLYRYKEGEGDLFPCPIII